MIIKEILSQLDGATAPIAKVLQKGEGFKVIVLAMKKGMILKEHKTSITTKLVVTDGIVAYKEAEKLTLLNKFEDLDIPLHIIHSVEAIEDSVCFLVQG